MQHELQCAEDVLEKIDTYFDYGYNTTVLTAALKSVILLHRDDKHGNCKKCNRIAWPCTTTQRIIKELK